VSLSKEGKAVYKQNKLRITLSPVVDDRKSASNLKDFFEKAGFKVVVFDNYKSMEWTKLIVNGLGSTAAITGLTPKETFRDERLFELEVKALKDRLTIMNAAGIPFAHIPWQHISLLPILKNMPTPALKRGRTVFAELIASGRANTMPSAARKIMEGKRTELDYYHKPFMDLGQLHGLRSPVDEAILEIITEHEKGVISLGYLTKEAKKDLLLKAYNAILQKPYICRDPFKTSIVEGLSQFFSKKLTVSGIDNLQIVRENLSKGKSVVLLANHLSHADHPTLGRAMRQNGFADLADRLTFVAGMRLKDEFLAKIFNNAYARILVSTPTTAPQTEKENRESQIINLKGFFEASRLMNKGSLLVIYPEGTRSRDGKLLKAIPAVARYLENPNVGAILPVGIQGTGDLLPVGKKIIRFKKTKISFGKPIFPAHLINDILGELPADKRNNYKRDKKIRDEINEKIMGFVMIKISQLLPEEQRGVYRNES
jgi:1-acyl-sn-glycerol-3-phosphate acyltransferase